MTVIADNLTALRTRMDDAAAKAGRTAGSVQMIAVSKFHDADAVRHALQAGQRIFGENRVQEAKAKFPQLRQDYPDIELHLIGPLQTNKAADAVKIFDVIQTLDRPELAAALAKAMQKAGRNLPCYIEINSGGEAQKAGIAPDNLPAFLQLCRHEYGLTITGLMCIPPQGEEPLLYFRQLKNMADTHNLPHVSMGMSADFESAIEAGATVIRIGTAIFGERPT